MFERIKNAFKKGEKKQTEQFPVMETAIAEIPKKEVDISFLSDDQKLIMEIHNEFDTVQDRLLCEADALLAELNIKTETGIVKTGMRLSALGFKNTPTAKQSIEISSTSVSTKFQADLIKHYKLNYPLLKFLTVKELNRICEKYGLVYAPVDNYIKDVPEKNISEIEKAKKLNVGDTFKKHKLVKVTRFWAGVPKDLQYILKDGVEYHSYSTSESDVLEAARNAGYTGNYTGYIYHDATVIEVDKQGLFICAPPSHFNNDGLTKEGFGLFKVTIKEIQDPIVFRFCIGGIQVLSKWGLEASDPMLLNEIEN